MNKKLLVLLTAALLLVASTATACGKKNPDSDETGTGNADGTGTKPNYIVIGTDTNGNDITAENPDETKAPTPGTDPSEPNPTFVDVTKKVVIFTAVATVRSSTVVADNNAIGWPSEGKILDVTGESEKWYRINYTVDGETTTAYIAKTVAADAAVLDTFTDIEGGEEVEISVAAVNVRSYPSADSTNSIRGSLKKGTKVTRVAVNDSWSRILYEEVSETETDAEGNPKKEIKQYYISNDCIKTLETEASTDASTETAAN